MHPTGSTVEGSTLATNNENYTSRAFCKQGLRGVAARLAAYLPAQLPVRKTEGIEMARNDPIRAILERRSIF